MNIVNEVSGTYLLFGSFNEAFDFLQMIFTDESSDLCPAIKSVTDTKSFGCVDHSGQKLIVYRLVHKHTRCVWTDLERVDNF